MYCSDTAHTQSHALKLFWYSVACICFFLMWKMSHEALMVQYHEIWYTVHYVRYPQIILLLALVIVGNDDKLQTNILFPCHQYMSIVINIIAVDATIFFNKCKQHSMLSNNSNGTHIPKDLKLFIWNISVSLHGLHYCLQQHVFSFFRNVKYW